MSQTLPYQSLHDYLCGVDRLTGEIKGFPFKPAAPQAITGAGGAKNSVDFNKVESSEQLATALAIDAKAEARFGLFGADASMAFKQSMSLNSYSIFVYAVANVERAFVQVVDPTYKDGVAELLKQPGGAQAFRAAYGDWFVRGITTGGQLLSLVEVRTTSEAHRQSLDAKMSVSYGVSFAGEGSVKQTFEQTIENESYRIVRNQVGGTPRHIEHPSEVFDQIKVFVDELTAPDCQTAVAYQVGTVSFDTVPVLGVQWVDLEQAEEMLDVLAQLRKANVRTLADIQYILTNKDEFEWQGKREDWVKQLQGANQEFAEKLLKIQQAASATAKSLTAPANLAELLDTPDYELPSRAPGTVTVEPTAPPPTADPQTTKDALIKEIRMGARLKEIIGDIGPMPGG